MRHQPCKNAEPFDKPFWIVSVTSVVAPRIVYCIRWVGVKISATWQMWLNDNARQLWANLPPRAVTRHVKKNATTYQYSLLRYAKRWKKLKKVLKIAACGHMRLSVAWKVRGNTSGALDWSDAINRNCTTWRCCCFCWYCVIRSVLTFCKLVHIYCRRTRRCLPSCSEYWTGLKVSSGRKRWS